MRPQPPRSPLFPYTTLFRSLALPALLYLHEKYASWESAMDVHDLPPAEGKFAGTDRKSTRLNSSHVAISYAVFCLKKKKKITDSTKIKKRRTGTIIKIVHS